MQWFRSDKDLPKNIQSFCRLMGDGEYSFPVPEDNRPLFMIISRPVRAKSSVRSVRLKVHAIIVPFGRLNAFGAAVKTHTGRTIIAAATRNAKGLQFLGNTAECGSGVPAVTLGLFIPLRGSRRRDHNRSSVQ